MRRFATIPCCSSSSVEEPIDIVEKTRSAREGTTPSRAERCSPGAEVEVHPLLVVGRDIAQENVMAGSEVECHLGRLARR
jgi:hypothetical protein